jgi:hypothetical protein
MVTVSASGVPDDGEVGKLNGPGGLGLPGPAIAWVTGPGGWPWARGAVRLEYGAMWAAWAYVRGEVAAGWFDRLGVPEKVNRPVVGVWAPFGRWRDACLGVTVFEHEPWRSVVETDARRWVGGWDRGGVAYRVRGGAKMGGGGNGPSAGRVVWAVVEL